MMSVEESNRLELDFTKLNQIGKLNLDVIPVVVQHKTTKEVLIVAYVNKEALNRTQESGYAVFWSTSRNELWEKGATSGNRLKIEEIFVNCEQNSLLFIVEPESTGVCHTKDTNSQRYRSTCYYRRVEGNNLI